MRRIYLLKHVFMLLAVLGVGYTGLGSVWAAVPQCTSVTMPPAVQAMAEGMQNMSADGAELSFMQNMIRLGLGAIGMSEQAVSRATHPELRQFAQLVVDRRATEQNRFQSWILTLYGDGVYDATRLLATDVQAIGNLQCSGCEFEVRYMLAMIRHDAGVLAVANTAEQQSIHGRIGQAASDAARNRNVEIAQLQRWLACWYGVNASVVSPRACIRS